VAVHNVVAPAAQASKPPQRVQQVMSTFCEVTWGIGGRLRTETAQTEWARPKSPVPFLSTPSTVCQSPSAWMIAMLLAYAYFLKTVVVKSEV